jgi:CRP-like cAMP-binding protein
VEEGPRRTRLGTGDFFGEVALVHPLRRRSSRVVSLGYCRVLVLRRRDFRKLALRDPTLENIIRSAAERQLTSGYQKPPPLVLLAAAD